MVAITKVTLGWIDGDIFAVWWEAPAWDSLHKRAQCQEKEGEKELETWWCHSMPRGSLAKSYNPFLGCQATWGNVFTFAFSYSGWNYISGIYSGMSSDHYTHIRISRLQCKKSTKASCFHLWFTARKMHAYLSHYTRIWWATRVSKLQNTSSIFNFYIIK